LPGGIGATELLIILAILVVLFGATRVADIGKGLGRGIREFRRELKEGSETPQPPAGAAAKEEREPAPTSEDRSS
jgi:sec-independent protein translocase protein TatA